ncbi:DUF3857 domain-containing protein [Qipengyuania aurantiaca]|uniref:DUF3857 domain-containing protein n=1 Tax=Qipengyuania aurantiaca TaxID=2867233 RepID=A0ABX8ZLB2_9SPHN|nr:DUF3857 domain-containing protein [Qipengyuania aurantiaca]QZD89805.1 DUF3857 domain-containing protein [Qipengyuania aurantiaca]
MNDKMNLRTSRSFLFASASIALVFSSPALAGEDVVYADAPDWIEPAELAWVDVEKGPSTLIYDWQHRLEGGVVTSYTDTAFRIDNPDMLMQQGTISLAWMPDKGDLTVHRVEILRGDESIDLIGTGSQFEVIRREQGLEQRLLDGELTATLAVPGLKVGDILRVTHSVTTDDQALGEEMQASQWLYADPWKVGFSRARVSWPEGADVYWRAEDVAGVEAPELENGYRTIDVTLPIAKLPDMPGDAPSRFTRGAMLRVGTFADWQDLSRVFAPHYVEAARIADDGDVAAEARRIMGATSDPLTRAAMAVRTVQDDVSYLLNGLDGGNYMPQTAAETWEKRYGDCKAKSVLLFSLLSQMGIEAVPVLVSTSGGDAIPELLPIPGNFDHMIVRATIDGTDYWLDGTSAATRLSNIGNVPAFFHALPLTEQGADLVTMDQREPATPDMIMALSTDYSAGIDLPSLFEMSMTFSGPQGARLRAMADEQDEDTLRQIATGFANSAGAGAAVSDVTVTYDEEAAVGVMKLVGVMPSAFAWSDGRLRMESGDDQNFVFNPDRARPEWRDIPVQTPGPSRNRVEAVVILPGDASAFTQTGPAIFDESFANTRIAGRTDTSGNRIVSSVDVIQTLGEIAPAEISANKRAVRQINAMEVELIAPEDVTWRWQRDPSEIARRVKPLIEAYDAAVEFSAEDDYSVHAQRANFRTQIYDWEGALEDLDLLVEKDTSANVLTWRASVLGALGRDAEAIADARRAYELDPNSSNAFFLAELLAYDGKRDEALELLEQVPVSEEESGNYASTYATVAGLAGKTDAALELLGDEVADKPLNASVLNADCWFRGLFNIGVDSAMATCTKAIERATDSAPMLDSRAMVSYRMGDYDAALKDLDSALELVPGLSASLYLRGIVRLEQGDAGGREDIATALRMEPYLARRYAMHGVAPKD